jgi:hypothetical protein
MATLPETGPLKFSDLNLAKGVPATTAGRNLSDMYSFAQGVPTLGTISMSQLRGKAAFVPVPTNWRYKKSSNKDTFSSVYMAQGPDTWGDMNSGPPYYTYVNVLTTASGLKYLQWPGGYTYFTFIGPYISMNNATNNGFTCILYTYVADNEFPWEFFTEASTLLYYNWYINYMALNTGWYVIVSRRVGNRVTVMAYSAQTSSTNIAIGRSAVDVYDHQSMGLSNGNFRVVMTIYSDTYSGYSSGIHGFVTFDYPLSDAEMAACVNDYLGTGGIPVNL